MAFSIFVSYSTRDLALATQTKHLLTQTGSNVYVAEYSLKPGCRLSEEIEKAIKSCDLFILLWSVNSKSSEWVPQEIGIARGVEKPILPVVLSEAAKLPGFIKDLKYLPYYRDPGGALSWLQENVFNQVRDKQQREGLVWLGVGAVVLWLLSQKE